MRALPLILAAMVISACGDELHPDPPSDSDVAAPAALPLEVKLVDGTTFRGHHLIVALMDGADGFAQVSVQGDDGEQGRGWGAIGVAPVEDVEDGELTFAMRKLPLADGVANVSRRYAGETHVAAEGGVLEVFLGSDGEVDGLATATPPEVSASFHGPYAVECWVEPEALGQDPNGTGDAGMKVRIQDEGFESEFCRRFAAWR